MLLGTMFIYLTRWQNSYDYYDLNEEDSDLEGEGVFSLKGKECLATVLGQHLMPTLKSAMTTTTMKILMKKLVKKNQSTGKSKPLVE